MRRVIFERPMPKSLGGRYRIYGLIAEGGMGVVYRGYDPELQRPVAIKVPRPTEGTSEAFITEARRRRSCGTLASSACMTWVVTATNASSWLI